MIAGIGGTGVVTIGAILGTAAQIDGKGAGVLDFLIRDQGFLYILGFLMFLIFEGFPPLSVGMCGTRGEQAFENQENQTYRVLFIVV